MEHYGYGRMLADIEMQNKQENFIKMSGKTKESLNERIFAVKNTTRLY